MHITKLGEAGYAEALLGLSLSYRQPPERMPRIAKALAGKDGGHNKFLETLVTWWDVTAPRFWWQQFDTYRVGVTKQSESTMHTLLRRPLTQADFAQPVPPMTLDRLNYLLTERARDELKNELPEGFLQRRIVCVNYKALRTIITQRQTHPLAAWRTWCADVRAAVSHPEFLPEAAHSSQADTAKMGAAGERSRRTRTQSSESPAR